MLITAWRGGSKDNQSCAGYGFKVTIDDRDKYFKKDWKSVVLYLADPSVTVKVNIDKHSFWNQTCHELISKDIGSWLENNGFVPWPKGKPPKFFMEPISDARFLVCPVKTGLIEAIKKNT